MITVGLYGIPDTSHYGDKPTYTHDHGIAIMKDGRVITSIQLERYTGRKHDNHLPDVIGSLLRKYVNGNDDIRLVSVNSFVGSTFLSTDGNLRIEPSSNIRVEDIMVPASCRFYPDSINPKNVQAYIMCHEFAHIASILPFAESFEPNSLLVHIDGGAYDSSSSVWCYDGDNVKCLHYDWTEFKDYANNFNANPLVMAILGLGPQDHLSMPGKLMGYSSYGKSDDNIRDWLLENHWFLDYKGSSMELLQAVNKEFHTSLKKWDAQERICKDIAATIQAAFEDKVIEYMGKWAKATGTKSLYYSGGSALNIIANSRLEKTGIFEKIFIPPCVTDCGLALGAAAWPEYLDYGRLEKHSPFLDKFNVPPTPSRVGFDVDKIAELLSEGKILGICIGAGEIGPRALGHRSIIARADDIELKKRISESIKGREWYQPIAPIMMAEVAKKVLAEDVEKSMLSKYMLGAYHVKPQYTGSLAGVIHADGTVRAQVISSNDTENMLLYDILDRVYKRYGMTGLINTSFNRSGNPMVHNVGDALDLGREIGLDGVMINEKLHNLH
jgi:carbamoyltransferase